MSTGVVFEIKQMAIYDGPGLRTTIFLKGCPLRCMWCHNPEGLSCKPQLMVSTNNCIHCNRCVDACPNHGETCDLCGTCLRACPQGLRRLCGTTWEAEALAKKMLKNADYLTAQGGGITISGGEPTAQPEFLMELLDLLQPVHRAVETSGFCSSEVFAQMLKRVEYVMMDLKQMDDEKHRLYTGVPNEPILKNLALLKASGLPFRIRIPVIPGVNDNVAHYDAVAEALVDAKHLDMVELLPYHRTAGAKYPMVGEVYDPTFDTEAPPWMPVQRFTQRGIPCAHL